MYAEVNLSLSERNHVLAIPVTAVDVDSEASAQNASSGTATGHVMVVTPNNRVEVRHVALGLETSNDVEVRSGLNDGDLVVIGGRSALEPGEEVKPKLITLAASKS
jgi:macrolide-specific efflux system membrane fusion protein